MVALQLFIGHCKIPPPLRSWPKMPITPPAFFKHATSLELSLTPNFPLVLPCADTGICEEGESLHDVYDFHWLRLDEFQKLSSLKIWLAARGHTVKFFGDHTFLCITQLSGNAIKNLPPYFSSVSSVEISTPLNQEIEPEDGYVEELTKPEFKLWKRGNGDKFHPSLVPIQPGGSLDGLIYTRAARYVQASDKGY